MAKRRAFPHRIVARIDGAQYAALKEQAAAHGYQVALAERWILIPRGEDLYPGSLDDAAEMMARPLPSGAAARRKDALVRHNIYLTDAEYELVTRAAMKRGLVRGSYVTQTMRDEIAAAEDMGWPFPEGITNESVDESAKRMLRQMEEAADRSGD